MPNVQMPKAQRKCANQDCGFQVTFDPNEIIPTLALGYDDVPEEFTSYLTCANPSPHTYRYHISIKNNKPVIGDPVQSRPHPVAH